jgi:hypothetical protein
MDLLKRKPTPAFLLGRLAEVGWFRNQRRKMWLLLAMEATFSQRWLSLSEPELGKKRVDGWIGGRVNGLMLALPSYASTPLLIYFSPSRPAQAEGC